MRSLGPRVADILVHEFAIPEDYACIQTLRTSVEFPYRSPHWIRIQIEDDRKGPEVGLRYHRDLDRIILAEMPGTKMSTGERDAFERAVAAIGALQGDYSTPRGQKLLASGPRSRLSPLAARTCALA
jgi:hypothetical protein